MPTPALVALERAGVPFVAHQYTVDEGVGEGYGQAVAHALGVEPGRVFKTLVAVVDDGFAVAILPVDRRLSLKALARAAGGKKAAMADPADAERLTGYVTGGISPFGQRRQQPTFLDRSAAEYATVFVSAGRRGLQAEVAPADLMAMTGAVVSTLT